MIHLKGLGNIKHTTFPSSTPTFTRFNCLYILCDEFQNSSSSQIIVESKVITSENDPICPRISLSYLESQVISSIEFIYKDKIHHIFVCFKHNLKVPVDLKSVKNDVKSLWRFIFRKFNVHFIL